MRCVAPWFYKYLIHWISQNQTRLSVLANPEPQKLDLFSSPKINDSPTVDSHTVGSNL